MRLDAVTELECVNRVVSALGAGDSSQGVAGKEPRGGVLLTVNLDHMRRFGIDSEYRELNEAADLRVADGMPLIWASRAQRTPLPERVAGSNLVWSLTEAAAENDLSVYLLGGEGDSAAESAAIFRERYPGIRIAGHSSPRVGLPPSEEDLDHLAEELGASAPDLVYVALGSPKQDFVIEGLRDRLPDTWWVGVGISFSFVSGEVQRAPRWMQAAGLEWVHRLGQEPVRLARRYLLEGIPFSLRLLAASWARRGKILRA